MKQYRQHKEIERYFISDVKYRPFVDWIKEPSRDSSRKLVSDICVYIPFKRCFNLHSISIPSCPHGICYCKEPVLLPSAGISVADDGANQDKAYGHSPRS